MKFTIATVVAFAAAFVVAQEDGPDGPDGPRGHHRPPPAWLIKKNLACPTSGGTATVSFPCRTGPPTTGEPSHPHSRPTGEPTHHHKWDGTITVYPSGAPEVTKTLGIECQGDSGPSCSQVVFASMTCPHPTDKPSEHPSFSHKSFPTVTASSGETKTVRAHAPPTCKAATASVS